MYLLRIEKQLKIHLWMTMSLSERVMFDVTFEIYGCCMIDYTFSRLCLKDLSFTMAISFESVSCCILMNKKSDCSKTTLKERH